MADARKFIHIACSDALVREIENYRRSQEIILTVAEATRRLISLGLHSDRARPGVDQHAAA